MPKFRNDTIGFLDWATDYVDQPDPLSPAPRNPTKVQSYKLSQPL